MKMQRNKGGKGSEEDRMARKEKIRVNGDIDISAWGLLLYHVPFGMDDRYSRDVLQVLSCQIPLYPCESV